MGAVSKEIQPGEQDEKARTSQRLTWWKNVLCNPVVTGNWKRCVGSFLRRSKILLLLKLCY